MRRLLVIAVLAVSASPASGVVGGTAVSVQSAPWAVSIRQATRTGALLCSGAVLDPLHVLTAAHCMFDLSGNLALPSSLTVRAGASSYTNAAAGDAQQDRSVSSFRVHPGYAWLPFLTPDDVAVLALSAPLDLGTPQVQAAPLPAGSGVYPDGADVTLAGFGRESGGGSPDGSLNTLGGTVDEQGECGSFSNHVLPYNDAIAFCAAAPTASVCNGDSGAALVTADPPHTIVGIASAGTTGCTPGSHALYTNVEAPEILAFIRGDDHPPAAPRASLLTYVDLEADATLAAGVTLRCTSGHWDGSPSVTYEFVDTRTNQLLQRDARGSLFLTSRMAGARIACRAIATNAGGTARIETSAAEPVGAAPKLEIERLPALTVRRGRSAHVRVWLDPAAGVTGKYGVCLTPPARVGARACTSQRVTADGGGRFALTVSLRIGRAAPLGAAKLAVSAVAGASHGRSTALLRVVR
jgi:Trypsin